MNLPKLKKRYYSPSEAAKVLDVYYSKLRYWMNEFPTIEPVFQQGRYKFTESTFREVVEIKKLLLVEGYTIEEAKIERLQKTGTIVKRTRQVLAQNRKKPGEGGLYPLEFDDLYCRWLSLTPELLAELCKVSERTARRYIKAGEAPYPVYKLLDLYSRSRVLPDSWKHLFVNGRGNLEIYKSGEVRECDILNIEWQRKLMYMQASTHKLEMRKIMKRVAVLEQALDDVNLTKGLNPAANDGGYEFNEM